MKKLFHLLSVLFLVMPLWQSCDFGQLSTDLEDAVDNIEIRVALPNFQSFALFRLVDAKTNETIFGDCEMTFLNGENLFLYDILGNQNDTYAFEYGVLQLGVNPTRIPSISEPLEFTVRFSSPGYEPMIRRLSLTNEGLNSFIVKMVDNRALPSGVSEQLKTTSVAMDGNDALTSKTTISTPAPSVNLNLNAGTRLIDRSGYDISNVQNVTSDVRFYDPTKPAALEAYPGGLDVVVETTGGSDEQGSFISGGLFKIDMTARGVDVKSFSNGGVEMDVPISKDLFNPKKGRVVQKGDIIDLWSFDEEFGKWIQEGEAQIYESGSELRAKGIATHLSYWNFDYFNDDTCPESTTIQFSNVTSPFSAELKVTQPGYSKTVFDNISTGNNFMSIYSYPNNTTATITVPDDVVITPSTINLSENCGKVINVDVSYMGNKQASITTTMNLDIKCKEDTSIVIKPNWLLFVEEQNVQSNFAFYATPTSITSGKVQMDLVPGKEYEAFIYYEGERYEVYLQITGSEGNYIMNISANFEIYDQGEKYDLELPLRKTSDGGYYYDYTFYPEEENCDFLNDL